MLDGCSNPTCKAARANFNKMVHECEADRVRVASLEKVVKSQQTQIQDLESAKSGAIEKIAMAKLEVKIQL